MSELTRIRGGWSNVPEGWHTKTQLSKMGLKPIGEPIGEIYSGREWRMLYDIKETKEKRKSSEKQLAVLDKARQRKIELEEIRLKEEEQARMEEYLFEQEKHKECWFNVFKSWYERDFVILDTETTDLDGEIIEIAIIDKFGDVLFDSLVNPKGEISQGAYEVHGISKEMLVDAPTWPEVYPKIKEILENKLILIYNEEFDRRMINNSCRLYGLESIAKYNYEISESEARILFGDDTPEDWEERERRKPTYEYNCVMQSYSDYFGCRWVKLSQASGNWDQSHRAVDDCFDTLKVIKELWKECEIGVEV